MNEPTNLDSLWQRVLDAAAHLDEHSPPNRRRKLTFVQAVRIRRSHAEDGQSMTFLARRYGIDRACIRDILQGKCYRVRLGIQPV